jgi:7,8-dihydropterin-6-yl-methyl-4-(beta-D-ribofuranosyl)aminobenzene 5'-phosphate synthase
METIPLVPVESLTITTLVDNMTDLLLLDEGPAKRPPSALSACPSVSARFLEGGRTADLLRAEHGFSCLVTIEKADRATRIMFDAGVTPDGLVENMRRPDPLMLDDQALIASGRGLVVGAARPVGRRSSR